MPSALQWTLMLAVLQILAYTRFFPDRSYALVLTGTLLIHALSFAIWYIILWPWVFSPLRHLPEPKGGSFFNGQFSTIIKEENGAPMRRWINTIPNDGLIRYRFLFNQERIFLTSPKALSEVLVQKSYDFIKPPTFRKGLGQILGVGVILAEGDEHKIQRKHLMPAFTYRHIKDLYPKFWSKSVEVVKAISAEIGLQAPSTNEEKQASPVAVVKVTDWLTRVTLDIIGDTGMGYEFNTIKDPNNKLAVTYRELFAPSRQAKIIAMLSLFLGETFVHLLPVKRNGDILKSSRTIRGASRELIKRRQKTLNETGKLAEKDIISVALQSGGISEDNLVDQVMTFLVAGHETTSTAMAWALVALSRHPDIQIRLRNDIRATLPAIDDADTPLTAELIDSIPYLHAVCNEVLRVYPPVLMTKRVAAINTTILDQPVPKGTEILISPCAINLSTEQWGPDAAEFKPERWMGPGRANSGGAESNFSLLTFLHGPRSCIGQGFAKAEFAVLLAAFVGRFEVELENNDAVIEIETGITARPKGGLRLRMKALEGW